MYAEGTTLLTSLAKQKKPKRQVSSLTLRYIHSSSVSAIDPLLKHFFDLLP